MTRAGLEKCGHGYDRPRGRLQVPASRLHSFTRRTRINARVRRGKAAAPCSATGRMLPQLQASVHSITASSCCGSILFKPRPSALTAFRTFSPRCSLPRLWQQSFWAPRRSGEVQAKVLLLGEADERPVVGKRPPVAAFQLVEHHAPGM